jgi:fructoselysine-6-P-deglycase FrlB-like protein
MTKFLSDILNQHLQWQKCYQAHEQDNFESIRKAASYINNANRVILCSIGASYNAGTAFHYLMRNHHKCILHYDASELLYEFTFYSDDVIIFLTRSGMSVELVKICENIADTNCILMCITNDISSTIAKSCTIALNMHIDFDYSISVATYTTIILMCQMLRDHCLYEKTIDYTLELDAIGTWYRSLHNPIQNLNLPLDKIHYFLARSILTSAASAGVLLWEEAAKLPAAMKTIGNFRHGAQEILGKNVHINIFLNKNDASFDHDVSLIKDLVALGVSHLVISNVAIDNPNCILLPDFKLLHLAAQVPFQMMANYLALKNGENPDEFLYCEFIISKEGSVIKKNVC